MKHLRWLALSALLWPALVLSEPRADASKASATSGPTLRIEASADAKWLHIAYTVSNSDRTLLVYDRLFSDPDKQRVPDPEQVQRFIHGKTLRLWHGSSPVAPRGTDFMLVPHTTKLAPRATLKRTLRVALPTREYNAGRSEPRKLVETQLDEVVMFVEYSDAQGRKLRSSKAFAGAFEVLDLSARAPHMLQSNSVPLTLSVRRVEDVRFPRLHVDGD
jgi:hypothetical protein